MNKIKVLLVEDETTLSMIIKDTLEDEGFEVTHKQDGVKGLNSFLEKRPDIVIADVMMPNMDGFEMVKSIRKSDTSTPILFLTARSSLDDLVAGFELGANDYLKKPFKMLELIVRVKSLVNRVITYKDEIFEIGIYHFNSTNQILTNGNKSISLSHFENEILKRLCISRNEVVDANTILNELWNNDSFYNRNSLHVFIYKLRKMLSEDNTIKIINIRGIGYKLTIR